MTDLIASTRKVISYLWGTADDGESASSVEPTKSSVAARLTDITADEKAVADLCDMLPLEDLCCEIRSLLRKEVMGRHRVKFCVDCWCAVRQGRALVSTNRYSIDACIYLRPLSPFTDALSLGIARILLPDEMLSFVEWDGAILQYVLPLSNKLGVLTVTLMGPPGKKDMKPASELLLTLRESVLAYVEWRRLIVHAPAPPTTYIAPSRRCAFRERMFDKSFRLRFENTQWTRVVVRDWLTLFVDTDDERRAIIYQRDLLQKGYKEHAVVVDLCFAHYTSRALVNNRIKPALERLKRSQYRERPLFEVLLIGGAPTPPADRLASEQSLVDSGGVLSAYKGIICCFDSGLSRLQANVLAAAVLCPETVVKRHVGKFSWFRSFMAHELSQKKYS